ncbi:DUF6270 domain-containing protein [Sanguibacter sp. 4.1]|uniref:DUF6270 domain-containing protein n=1 Tax=Sanguibacter biliveldensis TaxID=3030830 RepID=A0AAF0Z4A0_9MICO|nr:DUF6270 domain-containing protein [Sanguibacter sp. 4.1]WPF81714.1 DUF6270 domain-containing protein [Sanguibacter sp. 4.1]
MTVELNDYTAYGLPVWHWEDTDALEASESLRDGIHVVGIVGGPSVHLLLKGQPLEGRAATVPVFFSAAVVARDQKKGPFFSGRAITNRMAIPWISLSDPTLDLDGGIDLGWYTGKSGTGTQPAITRILQNLAFRSGSELVLVGGSGGGFAALQYAGALGSSVSAFVWNPQTSILAYAPETVARYLAAVLDDTVADAFRAGQLDEVASALANGGIDTSLGDDPDRAPRRVFYLQNGTDWHLRSHAVPYIESNSLEHRGRGYYTNAHGHSLLISDFGVGHATPPDDIIVAVLEALLNPRSSTRSIYNSLSDSGVLPVPDFRSLPRDLRQQKDDLAEQLVLTVTTTHHETAAVVTTGALHPSEGAMRAVFSFSDSTGGRLNSTSTAPLSAKTLHEASHVTAQIIDGFGKYILTLDGKPADALDSHSPESERRATERKRVFIYGSCVSRDAFELTEKFEITSYVARSSVGSAFSEPITSMVGSDLSANTSAFQRRMVTADLDKTLGDDLRAHDFDVLLIDFIDERLAVAELDGGVVTLSPELSRCGITPDHARRVESGSEDHFSRFAQGWRRLTDLVDPRKIFVSRAFWAILEDPAEARRAREANAYLERLYDHVSETPGLVFIDYPAQLIRADPVHRWGPSPFHFVTEFYEHMIEGIATASEPDNLPSTSRSYSKEPLLVISETMFCDYEMDDTVLAKFAERFMVSLHSIANLHIPEGVAYFSVIYVSTDKARYFEQFSHFIDQLPENLQSRFVFVRYSHPLEGYGLNRGFHADVEKNPNKHAPRRDRLFSEALKSIEPRLGIQHTLTIRIALDDDDVWHSRHIHEVCRIARDAIAHSKSDVVGVGLQNCSVAYVTDTGVDVDTTRISRALTGNKFYVATQAGLARLTVCSPWSLPERFDLNTAERFERSGLPLLLTASNFPTWTYIRWGDNLSVAHKDAYYEGEVGRERYESVATFSASLLESGGEAATGTTEFHLQPRSLEVVARRSSEAVIAVETNAGDFDGEDLSLRLEVVEDQGVQQTVTTAPVTEIEIEGAPTSPVLIKGVMYSGGVPLSVGITRRKV